MAFNNLFQNYLQQPKMNTPSLGATSGTGITSAPTTTQTPTSPTGATQSALDVWGDVYNQGREALAPYLGAGQGAIGLLGDMSAGNFNFDTIRNDPTYQFTRDEALRAGNRQLAGMGLTDSSYGAGTMGRIGGQVAANAVNDIYNRNLGLAGLGQNAATNFMRGGGDYANSYADLLTGLANMTQASMLANQTLDAQQQADWMGLLGGLGGSVIGNWDNIAGDGGIWDTISGWW